MPTFAEKLARLRGGATHAPMSFTEKLAMVRGDRSIADAARARLDAQGINPAIPVDAQLPERPGFWQGLKEEIIPSWEAVKGVAGLISAPPMMNLPKLASTAYDVATGDFRGATETATAPLRRAVDTGKAVAASAVGGFRDRAQATADAARRGDYAEVALRGLVGGNADVAGLVDEFVGGDMAHASGRAVGKVALAAAPEVAGSVAGRVASGAGSRMVSKAEDAYRAAISTPETAPLAESMAQKMMDAGIKIGDPSATAARATAAESAALSRLDDIPKPKIRSGQQPTAAQQETIAQRSALVDEARFNENLRAIAEAMDSGYSVRNVLIDGIKRTVKGGISGEVASLVMPMLPRGVAGTATAMFNAAKTFKEITKTNAWKTAAPIWKRKFGHALQSGRVEEAAEIGAGIASGTAVTDSFGHAAAINALAAETEPLGSPDMRRQHVSSRKAFYVQPDGSRVEIPQNVMTAFANAPRVNATDSPLNAWLSAMGKQKKIATGGRVVFVAPGQGAEDALSGAPHAYGGHEWPVHPDRARIFAAQNNATDIRDRAALLTPPGFAGPHDVQWEMADASWQARMDSLGIGAVHGANLETREFDPNNRQNTILFHPKVANDPAVMIHELGHSVEYTKGLSPEKRAAFAKRFVDHAEAFRREIAGADDATIQDVNDQLTGKKPYRLGHPMAIITYYMRHANNPQFSADAAISEAFAELFGQYHTNPEMFKKTYPEDYELMRSIVSGGQRQH